MSSPPAVVAWNRKWLALAALLLAFCFLGSRGLYDPDEGRYTNVALTMLDSGDWMDPRRNEDTGHWTKPPLTYWAIGSSIAAFGQNTWAARLPMALSYLACTFLVWRMARRLAPGREALAALVYMTMLMPAGASQLVTTDFLLAAFQALAMLAFVESRFRGEGPGAWPWVMWFGFALAFMTKGPPALLPMAAVVVFAWLSPPPRPAPRWQHFGGLLLFLALAAPWFVYVTRTHPGLLGYFLGDEVVARVATNQFARHGEWWGWAEVYVPTLLLGSLPWTRRVWAWVRALPASARRWRAPEARVAQAPSLLVALWIALPLLVFCVARSRLPLYLLPLFVPLALAVAQQSPVGAPAWPRRGLMLAWLGLLLALRVGATWYPSSQDASAWARAIRASVAGPLHEVVFVEDAPRYGLHLYLDAEIEALSLDNIKEPKFNPEYDEPLATELAEGAYETGVVYVARTKHWPAVEKRVLALGYQPTRYGAEFHGRVFFQVQPRR